MKDAMRSKDTVALTTLRSLISTCTNELVATGKTPQDKVTDDIALTVIKRASKQRKDAIEQYTQGGRQDLVENEQAELSIIEKYLPQMMSKEQIKSIAEEQIAGFGGDKSKMGQIIGSVMKKTAGQADGSDVKEIVQELLK